MRDAVVSIPKAAPRATSVRVYQEGDAPRLRELVTQVFDRQRSGAYWAWRNEDGPDGPSHIHVLEAEGQLVGQMVHTPFATWVDGARVITGQSGDTFVIPGFQGTGGMKKLVKAFRVGGAAFDLRMNFPGARSAKLMELFDHGVVIGRIPTWTRSRGRGARLPNGARQLVGLGSRVASGGLALTPPLSVSVTDVEEVGTEFDELAAASARFASCIRIRDAAYLQWRWLDQPDYSWRVRVARSRRGGGLRGWAVYGEIGRADGLGKVVDLLAYDEAAVRALLLDAHRQSIRTGLRGATIEYQDPRAWSRRAMLRSGFLPSERGTRVMVRGLTEAVGASINELDHWYLSTGDQDWSKE